MQHSAGRTNTRPDTNEQRYIYSILIKLIDSFLKINLLKRPKSRSKMPMPGLHMYIHTYRYLVFYLPYVTKSFHNVISSHHSHACAFSNSASALAIFPVRVRLASCFLLFLVKSVSTVDLSSFEAIDSLLRSRSCSSQFHPDSAVYMIYVHYSWHSRAWGFAQSELLNATNDY